MEKQNQIAQQITKHITKHINLQNILDKEEIKITTPLVFPNGRKDLKTSLNAEVNTAKNKEAVKAKASCIVLCGKEYQHLAKKAFISKLTPNGFNMFLNYKDLIPRAFRFHLSLKQLIGKKIFMYVHSMNMDLEGVAVTEKHTGRGNFNIYMRFPEETPKYWRECLFYLWPNS